VKLRLSAVLLALGVGAASWAWFSFPARNSSPETSTPATRVATLDTETARREVPIGEQVGPLRFLDAWYLPRTTEDLGGREAQVIVFTTAACPIAQRYLPVLADLEREFRPRGVGFLVLNVGAGETLAEATAQTTLAGIEFPVGQDLEGVAARAVGATRTPEAVVLDPDGRLRYRGRIDDQHRFSGTQATVREPHLRRALEAVLAGRDPQPAETTVEGCHITLVSAVADPQLTWSEHVAPLFQRHCTLCHYEGGKAPFALERWSDVIERADTIAEVVAEQRMPPWFADPHLGGIENQLFLEPQERQRILSWLRAGAPAGDEEVSAERDPPPPVGFRIRPDLVLRAPAPIQVPAQGPFPYQYVALDHRFEEETWVEGLELLPSAARVLHHGFLMAETEDKPLDDPNTGIYLHVYVPGSDPMDLPPGVALHIPAGATLRLQLHYTPIGRPVSDLVQVGLRFPRVPVQKRLYTLDLRDPDFEIPPGAPAYALTGRRPIPQAVTLFGALPHMHARGKDMVLYSISPEGLREPLLVVGNYSFDWQREYRFAPAVGRLAKDSALEAVGRFDNSAYNPFNPDPSVPVRVGTETVDEMMFCWIFYTRDRERLGLEIDPRDGTALQSRP
jgi:hypothetical protein